MSQSLRNKLVPQRKDRLPVTLILTCYIKLQVPGSWSSCRSSGSSHTTEASTLPFFERQREALCGLHALNSALGAETFLLPATCTSRNQRTSKKHEANTWTSWRRKPAGFTVLFAVHCPSLMNAGLAAFGAGLPRA